MKLIKWITSLFTTPTYQDSVEQYINSKYPKSAAEVEFWAKRYDQINGKRGFI